ncbi:hypothetical protein [Devosia sp. 2618]|uniref:hypothetical protein n=1 Tax=Devosia sp. 2618 TaxID=3156454 RepID=UPI0033907A18
MRPHIVAALVATSCAIPALAEGTAALPGEVRAFIEKRDICDHFRGEEAYDAERAKQIDEALALNCTGTDAELARLRSEFAGDAAIIGALADYETRIE